MRLNYDPAAYPEEARAEAQQKMAIQLQRIAEALEDDE